MQELNLLENEGQEGFAVGRVAWKNKSYRGRRGEKPLRGKDSKGKKPRRFCIVT